MEGVEGEEEKKRGGATRGVRVSSCPWQRSCALALEWPSGGEIEVGRMLRRHEVKEWEEKEENREMIL